MSRPIIEVRNLGKLYRLGQFNAGTLREEAERLFKRRSREEVDERDFWAVKDVSFDVQPGEVLGIVGRNGAGKSTLLKLLSRITEPTEGSIRIRGRVASLLEVGTGFHPELTGRENIYLNGAILGMTHAEIRSKFDEIVDFAGIEKFLDTPVKRYSSGMYVRLAFAVAAHLEPEILIVDEVLAVGDAAFQKKCLGKMQNISAQSGRTVLFVSHNLTAVATLCTRALLMDQGRGVYFSDVKDAIDHYVQPSDLAAPEADKSWDSLDQAPGNENIRIKKVGIKSRGKTVGTEFEFGAPITISVEYWALNNIPEPILNLYLLSTDGSIVFETFSSKSGSAVGGGSSSEPALVRCVCEIPEHFLNEGDYHIQINFLTDDLMKLFDFMDAVHFSVRNSQDRDLPYYGRFGGHVHPKLAWKAEVL